MVVDGEAMVRRAIALVLRSKGWEADQASNDQDALVMMRRRPPDLIICDVDIPVNGGYHVLGAVRADPDLALIPMILMSASGDLDHAAKALSSGAQTFLEKPFTSEQLLSLISVVLGNM